MTKQTNRLGLSLFAVYLVLYGGFVLLAAFSPEWMERTPLAGVNLAIWYGFGLDRCGDRARAGLWLGPAGPTNRSSEKTRRRRAAVTHETSALAIGVFSVFVVVDARAEFRI